MAQMTTPTGDFLEGVQEMDFGILESKRVLEVQKRPMALRFLQAGKTATPYLLQKLESYGQVEGVTILNELSTLWQRFLASQVDCTSCKCAADLSF